MILPKLTSRLPRQRIAPVDLLPIDWDTLADPYYFREARIGLILGADIYGSLFRQGLRRSSCKQVVAQDTTLGPRTGAQPRCFPMHFPGGYNEGTELHHFWETEEVSVPEQPLAPEDALCEEHFCETYSRNVDGRFVVRLTRRAHVLLSGDNNRSSCARFLQALECRFVRELLLK
jgi:hypothetical protein